MTNTDLTFITNEEQQNLKARFRVLIKDTKLFDCLVGYFYSSGFHAIYQSLENTEKIRILIGINTSRQTFQLLENAKNPNSNKLISRTPKPNRKLKILFKKKWRILRTIETLNKASINL